MYKAQHWFDGYSRIHRFRITSPTTVTYASRSICDSALEQIRIAGRTRSSFARRDPCQAVFRKAQSEFYPSPDQLDASIVNVGVTISIDYPGLPSTSTDGVGSLYAKTDTTTVVGIDPETLELTPGRTLTQATLHPELKGVLAAAHARTDPETGDLFNYNLQLAENPIYRVYRSSKATGETTILATITDAPPAYLHSFFLTGKYVVLAVWNSHCTRTVDNSDEDLTNVMLERIAPLDPALPALWYVIDRHNHGGVVARFTGPAFFAFHSVNAWDDPDTDDVVCEAPIYADTDVLHKFYLENLFGPNAAVWASKGRSRLTRFRLRNVTSVGIVGKAEMEWQFDPESAPELPTLNPAYITRPHRYTYAVNLRGRSVFLDGIVKLDSDTLTATYWEKWGHTPGEPVFVRNPEGREEDDGVLLSVVVDGTMQGEGEEARRRRSYLLVLDARDLSEIARAEAVEGVQLASGFHGNFQGMAKYQQPGKAVEY